MAVVQDADQRSPLYRGFCADGCGSSLHQTRACRSAIGSHTLQGGRAQERGFRGVLCRAAVPAARDQRDRGAGGRHGWRQRRASGRRAGRSGLRGWLYGAADHARRAANQCACACGFGQSVAAYPGSIRRRTQRNGLHAERTGSVRAAGASAPCWGLAHLPAPRQRAVAADYRSHAGGAGHDQRADSRAWARKSGCAPITPSRLRTFTIGISSAATACMAGSRASRFWPTLARRAAPQETALQLVEQAVDWRRTRTTPPRSCSTCWRYPKRSSKTSSSPTRISLCATRPRAAT